MRCESPAWENATLEHITHAENTKQNSSTLRANNKVLRSKLDATTTESESAVHKAIAKKAQQTQLLKQELDNHLTMVNECRTELSGERQRAQDFIEGNLQSKVKACGMRLEQRNKRPEREKVEDAVQRALQTEKEDLDNAVSAVKNSCDMADSFLFKLNEAHQRLSQDHADKVATLQVELACLNVGGGVAALPPIPADVTVDKYFGNEADQVWVEQTLGNLASSLAIKQDADSHCASLRGLIESLDHGTADRRTETDGALQTKVKNTTRLQLQLTNKLHAVTTEMRSVDVQIQQTKEAIEVTRAPLARSERRLMLRQQRPQREAIHDAVSMALTEEHTQLKDRLDHLSQNLEELLDQRRTLQETHDSLKLEVNDKSVALQLDAKLSHGNQQALTAGQVKQLVFRPPGSTARGASGTSPRRSGAVPPNQRSSTGKPIKLPSASPRGSPLVGKPAAPTTDPNRLSRTMSGRRVLRTLD